MNFSQFFIQRPIFAAVLSLLILIGGAIILFGRVASWRIVAGVVVFAATVGAFLPLLGISLIGFLLLPLVGLAWLIFTIIGAMKANNGEAYRYPFALRLIK